ncbi:MAG: hypothetical protein J0H65_14660 [Rhizobiales bacterium]|nr:hypothetical protein [Hyphomicrobiales bacterium]
MSNSSPLRRVAALVISAVLLLIATGGPDRAARDAAAAPGVRLIMVEEPGCRFCRKWDAEIAPGYRKSAEGRFAPLKRVRRGARELEGLAPVVFTPTFIVMRADEEIGRVTGYPGADYFYPELRPILSVAGFFPGL